MSRLDGRIAIVTGAGSGIGREVALHLAQEGARVVVADIDQAGAVAGRAPLPDSTPYSASKVAVIALVHAGARALAEHGITVNAFSPGVVRTPLITSNLEDFARMDPTGQTSVADIEAGLSSGILLGRTATPADLVGTALFLASADSDYLTGQTIQVDGGMVLV